MYKGLQEGHSPDCHQRLRSNAMRPREAAKYRSASTKRGHPAFGTFISAA